MLCFLALWNSYFVHSVCKKVNQKISAVTLKVVKNVLWNWQVVAAISAEQHVLKPPTSPGMCAHTTL